MIRNQEKLFEVKKELENKEHSALVICYIGCKLDEIKNLEFDELFQPLRVEKECAVCYSCVDPKLSNEDFLEKANYICFAAYIFKQYKGYEDNKIERAVFVFDDDTKEKVFFDSKRV